MALESSFKIVSEQFRLLHDELEELHRTVVEKPLKGDVVLVDLFSDSADDLLGWMAEAIESVTEGAQASAYPVDLDRARRSLGACQDKLILVSEKLSSDLVSYDRIEELMTFGRERRGGWLAWATNVKAALESCRGPLYDAHRSLSACWQELTERIGTTNVSVHATNVGQQITMPASDIAREGVP